MKKIKNKFNFWNNLPRISNTDLEDTDIQETEKEIFIRLYFPKLKKKDLDISLTEDYLEVKAEKKDEIQYIMADCIRAEANHKMFYSKIKLPEKVQPNHASITYLGGILEIIAPKAEKKKRAKIKARH